MGHQIGHQTLQYQPERAHTCNNSQMCTDIDVFHGSTVQQRKYDTSKTLGGGERVLLQIQILK